MNWLVKIKVREMGIKNSGSIIAIHTVKKTRELNRYFYSRNRNICHVSYWNIGNIHPTFISQVKGP